MILEKREYASEAACLQKALSVCHCFARQLEEHSVVQPIVHRFFYKEDFRYSVGVSPTFFLNAMLKESMLV